MAAPHIVLAAQDDNDASIVFVSFNENVTTVSAQNSANYSFSGFQSVTSATYYVAQHRVKLQLDSAVSFGDTVTVSGIVDTNEALTMPSPEVLDILARPIFEGIGFGLESNNSYIGSGTILRPKFKGFSFSLESNNNYVGVINRPKFRGVSFQSPVSTVIVRDIDGNPIEGANVSIKSGVTENLSTTGTNGATMLVLIPSASNTLTISKSGFQIYRHTWSPVNVVSWEETLNQAVPIIVNAEGDIFVNLQPEEPLSQFITKA